MQTPPLNLTTFTRLTYLGGYVISTPVSGNRYRSRKQSGYGGPNAA